VYNYHSKIGKIAQDRETNITHLGDKPKVRFYIKTLKINDGTAGRPGFFRTPLTILLIDFHAKKY
jgi:hypothetical protein